jgi:putative ABC transport system permease protein
VRTDGEPTEALPAIREMMKEIDGSQPLHNLRMMTDIFSESISRPRFNSQLISLLTAIAFILTAVGIYGIISYSVSHRTHEIGIRLALGARPADIMRMIISHGLTVALFGIAIGLAAAFALTRFIRSLLYEVSPTDPLTFIAMPIVIAVVVIAATSIPARRATKVDPMSSLRYE